MDKQYGSLFGVVLAATLPGVALAVTGDTLQAHFLASWAAFPGAPKVPPWVMFPFSEYYLIGVVLGFLAHACWGVVPRIFPSASNAYRAIQSGKRKRILFSGAVGCSFGVGWLILSRVAGMASGMVMLGLAPAIAVAWWARRNSQQEV